jgi:hypothetical protein
LPPPTRAKRKEPQGAEGYDPLPGEQTLKNIAKSVKDLVKKN